MRVVVEIMSSPPHLSFPRPPAGRQESGNLLILKKYWDSSCHGNDNWNLNNYES